MATNSPLEYLLQAMNGFTKDKTPMQFEKIKTKLTEFISSEQFQNCMKAASADLTTDLNNNLKKSANLPMPTIDQMMLTFTKLLLVLLAKPDNKFAISSASKISQSMLNLLRSLPDTVQNDNYNKMGNQMFQPIIHLSTLIETHGRITLNELTHYTQKLKDYNNGQLKLSQTAGEHQSPNSFW